MYSGAELCIGTEQIKDCSAVGENRRRANMISNQILQNTIDGLKGICCICICILHFLLMFIPKGYIGWVCSAEASENPFDFYFADFPFSIFTNGSFALYVFMALISFIPAYSFF